MDMATLPSSTDRKGFVEVRDEPAPGTTNAESSGPRVEGSERGIDTQPVIEFRVYKRRWFGLFQLVLLNIIVSWDVSQLVPYSIDFPSDRDRGILTRAIVVNIFGCIENSITIL